MTLDLLWQKLHLFLFNDIYTILLTSPFAQIGILSVIIFATAFFVRKHIGKKTYIILMLAGIVSVLTISNYIELPSFFTDEKKYFDDELQEVPSGVTKALLVNNIIEPEMLSYSHWSGTYSPTTFVLTINDQQIEAGENKMVKIADDILEIRLDYAFLNGRRKGAKIVRYKIPEKVELVNITFDWRDEWQIIIDNADPIKKQEATFNKDLLEK